MSDARYLAMEVAEIVRGDSGNLAVRRADCVARLRELEGMSDHEARSFVDEIVSRALWGGAQYETV